MVKDREKRGPGEPLDVAACGLYCGACPIFRGCHDDQDSFTVDPATDPAGLTTCGGCRSEYLYKGCRGCRYRECAQAKGLATCASCPEAPCDAFARFDKLDLPHTVGLGAELGTMRELGEEGWSTLKRGKWTCASCGTRFSWYAKTCSKCGAPVPGFDATAGAEYLRPRQPAKPA